MCWSGEASLAVSTLGVAGALWARKKGSPTGRWGTVLYFTGMELLQAATYIVIDRCGLPANQWLTRASYAHIAFQPFFINLLALSFLPAEKARRLRPWVLAICGLGAAVMLSKLYVPSASWVCDTTIVPLCGMNTCSYHGDWHIAWRLYLSAVDSSFLCYFIPAFFVPLFYCWRWVLYHVLVGPLPAFFLTSNKDEMPAIWCLMSIGFLLALHVKPVEHWMAKPLRAPAVAPGGPLLDAADLRTGFGSACLLVCAYPVIRLSGGSEIFNWPTLGALIAALAGAFVFWTVRAASGATAAAELLKPTLHGQAE